jgi:hypothetical protein
MRKVNREWAQSIWAAVKVGDSLFWADIEWYPLDDSGHIGRFTSGGWGPIPRAVFRDIDTDIALAEWFLNLPPRGGHELLLRYPDVRDYTQAADRGVFVFDYVWDRPTAKGYRFIAWLNRLRRRSIDKPTTDGYRLVAYPTNPLGIEELPDWVRAWLEDIRIVGANFAEANNSVIDLSYVQSGLVS